MKNITFFWQNGKIMNPEDACVDLGHRQFHYYSIDGERYCTKCKKMIPLVAVKDYGLIYYYVPFENNDFSAAKKAILPHIKEVKV